MSTIFSARLYLMMVIERCCGVLAGSANVSSTAATIRAALSSEQLTARPGVIGAYTASASALLAVLSTMAAQTEVLAGQVEQGFGQHPDAAIYRS